MAHRGCERRGRGMRNQIKFGFGVENEYLVDRCSGQHQSLKKNDERNEEIATLRRQVKKLMKKLHHFQPYFEVCEDSTSNLEYKHDLDIDFQESIPYFYGNLDSDELEDWMSTLEKVFHNHQIPETRKVKLAKSHLRGIALEWWKYKQTIRQRNGKDKVRKWNSMKGKLRKKFLQIEDHAFVDKHKNGGVFKSGQPSFISSKAGFSSCRGKRSYCRVEPFMQTKKALISAPMQSLSSCFGDVKLPKEAASKCFHYVDMELMGEFFDVPSVDEEPSFDRGVSVDKEEREEQFVLPTYDEEVSNHLDDIDEEEMKEMPPIYDEYLSESEEQDASNIDDFEVLQPMYDQPFSEEFDEEFEEEWFREYMKLPMEEKVVSKPQTISQLNCTSFMEESVGSKGICHSIPQENEADFEITSADFVNSKAPTISLSDSKIFFPENQESDYVFALIPLKTVAGNGDSSAVSVLLQRHLDVFLQDLLPKWNIQHDMDLTPLDMEEPQWKLGYTQVYKRARIFKKHNKLLEWLILIATIT